MKKCIDWKNLKFIARPNTWFDAGTEVEILLGNRKVDHNETGFVFRGTKDGFIDEEYCSIFEFDWLNENNKIINSNVPNMNDERIHKNNIIENAETREKYNWLLNIKLPED